MNKYGEFISGFMQSSQIIDRNEANEQWAWYSRQLSDRDRKELESQGWEGGLVQGNDFLRIYNRENLESES